MSVEIITGDCLDVMRDMADASFDACLSDVPYGLGPREPKAQEIAEYVLGSASLDTGGDFMGKKWKIPSVAVWRELLRVLKPGAPVLAFAGSRTHDLITVGMRAAGFEIGDTISWEYSQGMPKPATTTDKYIDAALGAKRTVVGSRELTGNAAVPTKVKGGTYGIQVGTVPPKTVDVTAPATDQAKRWAGYGHALRPSHEPITLAYKPYDGTIADNILKWDVGALNVVGCRIGTAGGTRKADADKYKTNGVALDGSVDGSLNGGVKEQIDAGRWPANVLLSHDDRCRRIGTRKVRSGTAVKRNGVTVDTPSWGGTRLGAYAEGTPDAGYAVSGKETVEAWDCIDSCPVRIMDEQSGHRKSTLAGRADPSGVYANPGENGGASLFGGGNSRVYADEGGASRCFYQPKVSRSERELGCEHLPLRSAGECTDRDEDTPGLGPQAGAGRTGGARNFGPCLKPIALTRYLALLALPPPRPNGTPRRILVLYAGTGSEAIGAMRAGWEDVVGIERDPEYVTIAKARIARWAEVPESMTEADAVSAAESPPEAQATLFGALK